jgi:transposase-like protein
MPGVDNFFKGRHFDREIIILRVRRYVRFKLSFRNLVEMMAERGVSLAHATIMRWTARYVSEFEKRWNRFACRAGASWRVDKSYVKIKGCWAVDKQGKTVAFLLCAKRDVAAAKAFFRRAFNSQALSLGLAPSTTQAVAVSQSLRDPLAANSGPAFSILS